MKAWFFVNPRAGRVRQEEVERALAKAFGPDDAVISTALPESMDASGRFIAAVGGDGTVNRVINAFDPKELWLAVVPRGSANDLAAEMEIPADISAVRALIRKSRFEHVDLIEVNGTRFATCGGFGLASDVAELARRWREGGGLLGVAARSLGSFVYAVATVVQVARGVRPIDATIRLGSERRETVLCMAIVSNQPRFGGRFSASPMSCNRDGLAHVAVVLAPTGRLRLLWICYQIFCGRPHRCSEIISMRGPALTIETGTTVTFFGDGEPLARGHRFDLTVLAGALRVTSGRRDVGPGGYDA